MDAWLHLPGMEVIGITLTFKVKWLLYVSPVMPINFWSLHAVYYIILRRKNDYVGSEGSACHLLSLLFVSQLILRL